MSIHVIITYVLMRHRLRNVSTYLASSTVITHIKSLDTLQYILYHNSLFLVKLKLMLFFKLRAIVKLPYVWNCLFYALALFPVVFIYSVLVFNLKSWFYLIQFKLLKSVISPRSLTLFYLMLTCSLALFLDLCICCYLWCHYFFDQTQ